MSQLESFVVRAPWAAFGLAPLFLLAGAYFVACLILWSGWRLFLPGTITPFVPLNDDGFAIVYFGVGRMLYYVAPVLVGWSVAFIAARQKLKPFWPCAGLAMIALMGGAAQVHAWRPALRTAGHVSMSLALDHPAGMVHASIILGFTMLPYLLLRLQNVRRLSA
ncbi:MAG: hypothetical protein JOY93_00340 [Acidobacteriales bacterium]|nr:hypothetical protein [Terriglobales bacterium]